MAKTKLTIEAMRLLNKQHTQLKGALANSQDTDKITEV